ncbi:MAG: hypothetical protein ACRYGF_17125 [Janthinobacterium lividum]
MRIVSQLLDGRRTRLDANPAASVCTPTNIYTAQNISANVISESWLDQRANDVRGEWTVARLGGLSRTEGKVKRLQTLAALTPLQELYLEADAEELNAAQAVRVFTMSNLMIGYLEPSAAAVFYEQSERNHVVLGYVYQTNWLEGMCTHVLIALLSWLPFKRQ